MSFEYDRGELLMSLTGALSEFFFRGVGDETTAGEIRERSKAMGVAIGRIQAVIMERGEIGPSIVAETHRLERLISDSVTEGMGKRIRPGGDLWKTLQERVDGD